MTGINILCRSAEFSLSLRSKSLTTSRRPLKLLTFTRPLTLQREGQNELYGFIISLPSLLIWDPNTPIRFYTLLSFHLYFHEHVQDSSKQHRSHGVFQKQSYKERDTNV